MEHSKKFAFDVGWSVFSSVSSVAITFLLRMFLARYFGPAGLGLLTLVIIIQGIAVIIGTFGIPIALTKYAAEYKGDRDKLNQTNSSALVSSIGFGVVLCILLYTLSSVIATIFNKAELARLLKILALAIPFIPFLETLQGLLIGLREMKIYAYLLILRNALNILLIIALVEFGFGVEGAVFGIVLSALVGCMLAIIFLGKYLSLNLDNILQNTKNLVSFGSQVFGANAVNFIAGQVDVLIIGYYLANIKVGYYSAAVSMSLLLFIIPEAIQRISIPVSSEYWSKNNLQGLQSIIDKSMKYSASIVLPIGLGMGFFAKEIITLIFGAEFIYAVLPFCILLIARVVRGATIVPVGGSFSGIGRPDVGLKLDALSSVLSIGLSILFIPRFGLTGAAMATTTSLLAGCIIGLILLQRIVRVNIDVKWYAQAIGLACIAIVLFTIGTKLFNHYIVGGVVLLGYIILFFKVLFVKEDKDLFYSLAYSLVDRK